METLDFDQVDAFLATVAARQQLEIMLAKKTDQSITDLKIINGYWCCYVAGIGWMRTTELLSHKTAA